MNTLLLSITPHLPEASRPTPEKSNPLPTKAGLFAYRSLVAAENNFTVEAADASPAAAAQQASRKAKAVQLLEVERLSLVAGVGFEPNPDSAQDTVNQPATDSLSDGYTQIGAQIPDSDRRSLARIVETWPRLNDGLKLAILAIINAERGEGVGK